MGVVRKHGEFDKLKHDAGLIPRLVEEAVRWTTPVHHVMRTATADVKLRGRQIAKGDWLMLSYLSANRDEEAFDQPDRFLLRRNTSRSALFGQEPMLASVSIWRGSRCESSSRSCCRGSNGSRLPERHAVRRRSSSAGPKLCRSGSR